MKSEARARREIHALTCVFTGDWGWTARLENAPELDLEYGSGSQDSVSAYSGTAVRGSSSDRTAQSANAPIAYGAV